MTMDEQYITAALQVMIGAALTLAAWFINRSVGRVDSNEKSSIRLTKELGLLEASNAKLWEVVESLTQKNGALNRANRLLGERVLEIEILMRKK